MGHRCIPLPTYIYPTETMIVSMPRTKLDERGRISIPAPLRRELGLEDEAELVVEREGSKLILRKVAPEIPTVNSRGGWKKKPVVTASEALGGP